MRLIDGDRLMMSLADWWYSSFGEEETEEATAIRKVMDKVEESLDAFTVPQWLPLGRPMNSGQHYIVTLRQKFEGEETYRVRIMRLNKGHWVYPRHLPEWINDEM